MEINSQVVSFGLLFMPVASSTQIIRMKKLTEIGMLFFLSILGTFFAKEKWYL
jgi:hypothetical protein